MASARAVACRAWGRSNGQSCSKRLPADPLPSQPLVFVLVGPGGAGKGTVAERLSREVPNLWLSRSWTTRRRRSGEEGDAYSFVSRDAFEARVAEGGFLEWAEFLGNLYGTPLPSPPPGHDVLLEIDVEGARQVLERCPDAIVVLLMPPSTEVQRERLVARGDSSDHVRRRLVKGEEEARLGRALAREVVVNDDVHRAVERVAGILEATRARRRGATPGPDHLAEPGHHPEDA